MADEEESEAEGKGKGKKGDKPAKGKSNLVPAVVVALGLVVGGKMMGSGKTAAPAAAAAAAPAEEGKPMDCTVEDIKKPPVEGAIYKLDSMAINLADSHYAKVTVALQLSSALDPVKFKEESEYAKAAAIVNAVISGRDKAEFGSPQAMEALTEKITTEVRPKYECQVLDVLFTEFVIQ